MLDRAGLYFRITRRADRSASEGTPPGSPFAAARNRPLHALRLRAIDLRATPVLQAREAGARRRHSLRARFRTGGIRGAQVEPGSVPSPT